MDSKKVKYSELVEGNEYYKLCCGQLSKIKLLKILDEKKILILYPELNFETKDFMSDSGIVGCPGDYGNDLNALFFNKEDAIEYSNSLEYATKMELKKQENYELDEMINYFYNKERNNERKRS